MQISKPFLDVVPIDVAPIDVMPRGDAKGIAATLAAAFVQDPFMSYVFPEAFKREPQLKKLLTPVVRYAIAYGKVELLGDGAQGKGLAKRLIHKALDSMRESGHSACVLRTDNENNVAFYQRLGFSMIDAGIVPSS